MNSQQDRRPHDAAAVQFMVMDLLESVLTLADSPSHMAEYLTRQLRELLGGRIVALLQHPDQPGDPHRLVGVAPERYRTWEGLGALEDLAVLSHGLATCTLWDVDTAPEAVGASLQRMGIPSAIVQPLQVGSHRMGCLFLLHLLDSQRSRELMRILDILSPVVALILRNALLFESQEATIRTRTAQLVHAQKMESIGRLAGGVAHDFNNMLGVIIGHIDLMKGALPADSPLAASLGEIEAAAGRSRDITRQLLAFSRKQVLEPRVIDLNASLEGILRTLTRIIGEDVALTFRPAANLGFIRFDPTQIDQILVNLAVNAKDAMPQGGELRLETAYVALDAQACQDHPGARPGPYARLTVTDTGMGMDEAVQAHIFEPFYTTKGLGQGTGLGLSTVLGIVEQGGGCLDVVSHPGKGTTFRIHFPIVAEALDAPHLRNQTPVARGRGTVLVVEDDEMLRGLIPLMLDALGYTVILADTPRHALEVCARTDQPLALLLTDVVMPEMGGKELRDRAEALRPGLKVLLMSGYTADVIARRGVLDGGLHFLHKPFTVQELGQKIAEVLG
jgi:signal transduction histidine kinase/CheY-like chemotaxis protein